ncbi:hypothetical protein [Sutcliffiella rhizosphaerae]|nr:hypothetical protein [Sutcliffiella rhizosphaerae]
MKDGFHLLDPLAYDLEGLGPEARQFKKQKPLAHDKHLDATSK